MAEPLTEHLLAAVYRQVNEGVDTRSILALCSPELFYDLGQEYHRLTKYHGVIGPSYIVLYTPAGPVRVQEDHGMWKTDGIVVYRQVGHVPVHTAKVSL